MSAISFSQCLEGAGTLNTKSGLDPIEQPVQDVCCEDGLWLTGKVHPSVCGEGAHTGFDPVMSSDEAATGEGGTGDLSLPLVHHPIPYLLPQELPAGIGG